MGERQIPESLLRKAELQSKHLEDMLIAAQQKEEQRDKMASICPKHRRQKLEERFEMERKEEALRITRIQADHIALLNHEANQDTALVRHAHRKKGAFLVPEGPKKDAPGSTLKDLEFMKEMARKLDIQEKVKHVDKKCYQQAIVASRLSCVKVPRSEVLPARSQLLKQRDTILQRLSELRSQEDGQWTQRSRISGMNTARSNYSDVSAATFCDTPLPIGSSRNSSRVPSLRMSQVKR